MMNIDVHTHIVPESFPPVGNRPAGDLWPKMESQGLDDAGFEKSNVVISGRNFRTVLDRCWSSQRRIDEMPSEGFDKQVLSPMPELLAYRLAPDDGLALSRVLSETIARMMDYDPNRFFGLGAVPLQDVDLACRELSNIKSLGLQGVEILSNIQGISPGDPKFLPFFKEAESLGTSIFIHSQHPTFGERIEGPPVWNNAVGFPIESALAGASLIGGGVLKECPELRGCMSHGGGTLAQILPRLDYFWGVTGPSDLFPDPPSTYAKKLFYDDILFNNQSLRFLIDSVGSSQIMLGSDYPFQFRPQKPDDQFIDLKLTKSEIEGLSHTNCLRFLGLLD